MLDFFEKILEKWKIIVYTAVIFGLLTFSVSAFLPPKYLSVSKILIIQKNSKPNVAIESVNYLSDIFIEVAYTETFLMDVLNSPFGIAKEFSSDSEKRKSQWKEMLKMTKIDNAGIIEVAVFDTSKKTADKIAGAVSWNLIENGKKYYGDSSNVIIKNIDGPITASSPAYPNVFLAGFLGALAGAFVSLVVILSGDFVPVSALEKLPKRKEQSAVSYDENEIVSEENMASENIFKGDVLEPRKEDIFPMAIENESEKETKDEFVNFEDMPIFEEEKKADEKNEPSQEEVRRSLNMFLAR